METLVKFFFWWMILSSCIYSGVLVSKTYPRKPEVSLGSDLVSLILRLFLIGWISIVLFM